MPIPSILIYIYAYPHTNLIIYGQLVASHLLIYDEAPSVDKPHYEAPCGEADESHV